MPPEKRPETAEEFNARWLAQAIEKRASRLRDLADRLDRCAEDVSRIGNPGYATYAADAAEVQNEVAWGVANLHLEQLTTTAADADVARIKGE
jgi:hypothetical protein